MISSTENHARVSTHSPVIVALDYEDANAALAFVDLIDPRECRLKVGKEMFTFNGPQFVKSLHQRGFDVFLDCLLYTSPSPRDRQKSRMPSSA